MKFIAHRGNVDGPNPELENSPGYILSAIDLGYDVEIDVWRKDDVWYLGHDEPQYETNTTFLRNRHLWCHAKNLDAFKLLLDKNIHCFWHQEDDYTLTSKGYIWAYPGKQLSEKSVCVMPETTSNSLGSLLHVFGLCSDYVSRYKENIAWGHIK